MSCFFLYASDIPHWDGEFPKNLEYLWKHLNLSRETKEKIAYHNGRKFFQLCVRPQRRLSGKRSETKRPRTRVGRLIDRLFRYRGATPIPPAGK